MCFQHVNIAKIGECPFICHEASQTDLRSILSVQSETQ